MAAAALFLATLAGCQKYSVAADDQSWDFRHASMERNRDFDFLAGSWQVANRRLRQRHVGSQDWDEFPARLTVRPLMGGRANIDEIDFPTKGWSGVTVRFYEPSTREWAIYWVNSRDGGLRRRVTPRPAICLEAMDTMNF